MYVFTWSATKLIRSGKVWPSRTWVWNICAECELHPHTHTHRRETLKSMEAHIHMHCDWGLWVTKMRMRGRDKSEKWKCHVYRYRTQTGHRRACLRRWHWKTHPHARCAWLWSLRSHSFCPIPQQGQGASQHRPKKLHLQMEKHDASIQLLRCHIQHIDTSKKKAEIRPMTQGQYTPQRNCILPTCPQNDFPHQYEWATVQRLNSLGFIFKVRSSMCWHRTGVIS